jgi:2-polyprenyl-6-methoxyphenol hydroxylase-like FAD-dependent oxidoreductase
MSLPSEGTVSAVAEVDADLGAGLEAEVLVAGAGPVGCWLAAELAAAGVRVLVLEARETRVNWSRGFIVHPRSLEIFESRGVAAPLVASGRRMPTWHFAMGSRRLDFTALPSSFPFVLLQPQARTEELLEQHLNRSGGTVLRRQRVLGLTQHPGHVRVRVLHDGVERTVTARFVVGCDGARSVVRQSAGIAFAGNPDTLVSPSALVELADPPPPEQYMQAHEQGLFFAIPLPDGRFVVSTVDHAVMNDVGTTWTADMVRASLVRITGSDYGMGEAERVSTLGNAAKQAARYREHRVLLAGDAAHVHFPMGGQGLNLGIQDAHDLAWRLIAAVRAERGPAGAADAAPGAAALPRAVADLLDGYEAERRPVGERVLEDVRAQMALVAATGADGAALRSRFNALLGEHPEVNLEYARRLSGLDVRYPGAGFDGAESDPRFGARVPDLELELFDAATDTVAGADGQDAASAEPSDGTRAQRLYPLLRALGPGRFLWLIVGDPDGPTALPGSGVEAPLETPAEPDRAADGPLLGTPATVAVRRVIGPDWALRAGWGLAGSVLIRPDGHVAAVAAADGLDAADPLDAADAAHASAATADAAALANAAAPAAARTRPPAEPPATA